eukprot:TRINITY_DN1873_c0_g1_i10.p1 TRINITY_DN1873_c0_g1~~TRINITY_DN1873_c0_g1_i10.p1  ORF type:complete len:166 (-),score=25.18 TRINITY_DN1873_c0_g1_i10:109-606(-)
MKVLIFSQCAQALDVVFAILGMTRTNWIFSFIQIGARLFVIFCSLRVYPDFNGAVMVLLAWSLADIIRFGYYFFKDMKNQPYFIKWLRYSAFIVLYPLGMIYEWYALYCSKDAFFEGKPLFSLPTSLGKIVYMVLIFMTPFLFLMLYTHMFRQRKKTLRAVQKRD